MSRTRKESAAQQPQKDGREKKRRSKKIWRTVIIGCCVALVIIVGFNWDTMSPVAVLQRIRAASNEQGAVTQYPLDVAAKTVAAFCDMGKSGVLVTDAGCTVLKEDKAVFYAGKAVSPSAAVGSKAALIYSDGGNYYAIYSEDGKTSEGTSPFPIKGGAVSRGGSCALLISPTDYSTKLVVNSATGSELFSEFFSTPNITDVALSDGADRCAVIRLDTRDGSLVSVLTVYDISQVEPLMSAELGGLLELEMRFDSTGGLCVVCDYATVFYDSDMQQVLRTDYDGLTDFAISAECRVGLICDSGSVTAGKTLTLLDSGGELYNIEVEHQAGGISVFERECAYVSGGRAVLLNSEGAEYAYTDCTLDTYKTALCDGFLALVGNNKVTCQSIKAISGR